MKSATKTARTSAGRGPTRAPSTRACRIAFQPDRLGTAIQKHAKRTKPTWEAQAARRATEDWLQSELVRAGLAARLSRLLAGGGPSVETLFVIARALELPMEHFLEEAA